VITSAAQTGSECARATKPNENATTPVKSNADGSDEFQRLLMDRTPAPGTTETVPCWRRF
jgi:hypothetical protein